MCGTALTMVGAILRTNASIHVSGRASSASRAAIKVTIPAIAAWGAAIRITSVATKHSRPPSVNGMEVLPPAPSFVSMAAKGLRETMSLNGLRTATDAAPMPPITEMTMLCQLTTRSEPTAKADER